VRLIPGSNPGAPTRCNIKVLGCLKDERRIDPSGRMLIFTTANMKQNSLEKLIVLNLNRQPQDHYLSYHFPRVYVKSEKPRSLSSSVFLTFSFILLIKTLYPLLLSCNRRPLRAKTKILFHALPLPGFQKHEQYYESPFCLYWLQLHHQQKNLP